MPADTITFNRDEFNRWYAQPSIGGTHHKIPTPFEVADPRVLWVTGLDAPPRVRAAHALLCALGLPTENVRSVAARISNDRNGDHVAVTYNLGTDDAFDINHGGDDE